MGAESLTFLDGVLDAVAAVPGRVPEPALAEVGFAGAATGCAADGDELAEGGPAPAMARSSVGDGRASLLAAQASDAKTARITTVNEELLFNKFEVIS